MKRKTLLCLFLLLITGIFAAVAVAAEDTDNSTGGNNNSAQYNYVVELGHNTRAHLVNNKSDYSAPVYQNTYIEPYARNESMEGLAGTITLNVANQTNYTADGIESEFSSPTSFKLVWNDSDEVYNLASLSDDTNAYVTFTGGAETGFSGQSFSVEIPTGAPVRENSFSAIHTTADQIANNCVPYVELITSGSQTTGVKWRFVNPSAPEIPLTRTSRSDIRLVYRIRIRDKDGNKYTSTPEVGFGPGDTLSGEVTFDEPVATENIEYVRIGFEYGDSLGNFDSSGTLRPLVFYQWLFYADSGPSAASTYVVELRHNTRARLVNNKSDYSAPVYQNTYIEPYARNESMEGLAGTITLNVANQTNYYTEDGIESEFSSPTSFKLVWNDSDEVYNLASLSDDTNAYVTFTGGAETGFSGQSFSVEIPTGAPVRESRFSAIHTTADQVANNCVPYVELITSGSQTTGVKWRFVNPSAPEIPLIKTAKNDIRLVYRIRIRDKDGNNYTSTPEVGFGPGATLSGEVTFDEPVVTDNIEYVRIGFEYDDSLSSLDSSGTLRPLVFYQWRFYADSGSSGTPTAEYEQGSNESLTIKFSADYKLFSQLSVDDVVLRRDTDYSVSPGSIVITLFPSYLETLSEGTHEVAVQLTDSSTLKTSLTVREDSDSDTNTKGRNNGGCDTGTFACLVFAGALGGLFFKGFRPEKRR